jgi:mono/diheme cytochrome c family protein
MDATPDDPATGCLNSRNLTNHETGLKNRSDEEIKQMFLRGVRPDGRALHPMMPYAFYANMRESDADAIVAYLRTVPGVDRQVPRSQPPFDVPPEAPQAQVPEDRIPMPRADYPDREAALRGRYIAGNIGTCMNCHTPKSNGALDLSKAFQGGQTFASKDMKLPPSFPELIYTSNLTPDVTGIRDYSVADVVRAVKHGEDMNQGAERLCPPMPAGPVGTFGGLTDADASDIGHYLLSLPPVHNPLPDCSTSGAQHASWAPKPSAAEPIWLSQTGLYRDVVRKQVASDLLEFEPAFALWSDGADKRRWLRLPKGERIDTRDPDNWQFPSGTLLFKEFSRDGRRLETRVIARTGVGPRDYWMGAFVWNEDETDARYVPEGQRSVRGTDHDAPSSLQCGTCHNGEPGRVLGFSAVQQPNVDPRLLTQSVAKYVPPGDARTVGALGYLHANCAHCHNPLGTARPDTDMNLRLSVSDRALDRVSAVRTAIDQPVQSIASHGPKLRAVRAKPEESALLARMRTDDPRLRMPPLGAKRVDERGVELVRAWIAQR